MSTSTPSRPLPALLALAPFIVIDTDDSIVVDEFPNEAEATAFASRHNNKIVSNDGTPCFLAIPRKVAIVSDQGTAIDGTDCTIAEYANDNLRQQAETRAIESGDCKVIEWRDVSRNDAFWPDWTECPSCSGPRVCDDDTGEINPGDVCPHCGHVEVDEQGEIPKPGQDVTAAPSSPPKVIDRNIAVLCLNQRQLAIVHAGLIALLARDAEYLNALLDVDPRFECKATDANEINSLRQEIERRSSTVRGEQIHAALATGLSPDAYQSLRTLLRDEDDGD